MGKKKRQSKGPNAADLAAKRAAEEAMAMALPLIEHLHSGTDQEKICAAQAFSCGGNLPVSEIAISPAPIAGDAIRPLVRLLDPAAAEAPREAAALALRNLTDKVANVYDPGDTPLADLVVKSGGIEPLVALVGGGNALQKEHAAGILANVANTAANRSAVVTAGGVAPLLALVRNGTVGQREQGAFALGSLAFHHNANRAAISKAGGAEVLTALLEEQDGTPMQQSIAEYALHNLTAPFEDPNMGSVFYRLAYGK